LAVVLGREPGGNRRLVYSAAASFSNVVACVAAGRGRGSSGRWQRLGDRFESIPSSVESGRRFTARRAICIEGTRHHVINAAVSPFVFTGGRRFAGRCQSAD